MLGRWLMLKIDVLVKLDMILGECPCWNDLEQSWYWVDIIGNVLYRYNTVSEQLSSQRFNFQPAFFAFTNSNQIIITSSDGLYIIQNFDSPAEFLVDPESHLPFNRFNDGVVTPNGDFLAGTIGDGVLLEGTLYHFDINEEGIFYKPIFTGFRIINGQAFSPDGKWFYLTDTPDQKILKYPFDSVTKEFGVAQLFYQFSQDNEYPDGAAIDSNGNYWIAMYGSGKICVISPEGRLINEVILPITQPTMIAFGGLNLDKLIVTSASQGLSKEQLKKEPLAGSVLVIDVNVSGVIPKRLNSFITSIKV